MKWLDPTEYVQVLYAGFSFSVLILALVGILFGGFSRANALTLCANSTAITPSGGVNQPDTWDGTDYAMPFTVSASCDVTDIQILTKAVGAPVSMGATIWDASHTVLVTGSNVSPAGGSCGVVDSLVTPGTVTLTASSTYYVGYATNASHDSSNYFAPCVQSSNSAGTLHNYWAAGWNAWSVSYGQFEIDTGSGGGGGGSGSPTAATSTDIQTVDNLLFHVAMVFFICVSFSVWMWQHLAGL